MLGKNTLYPFKCHYTILKVIRMQRQIAKPKPRKRMKAVLCLGTNYLPPRMSRQVLRGLARKHDITAVVVPRRNPIRAAAKKLGVPVVELLPELEKTRPEIQRSLEDPAFRRRLGRWVGRIRAMGPDIGVSFYSGWVPPELYTTLRHRFINYHPSDLTDAKNGFKGVLPEIAHIMSGNTSFRGTVHELAEGFDAGGVLMTTPRMRIGPGTTTRKVYSMAIPAGVKAINAALDKVSEGKAEFRLPTGGVRNASKRFVRGLSQISLGASSAESVQRAVNALNHEPEGILKDAATSKGTEIFPMVRFDGVDLRLSNAKIYKGRVPRGRPGEIVGFNRGRPIVQTSKGAVMLDFMSAEKLRRKMQKGKHFS